MHVSGLSDDASSQQSRFRVLLQCGIGIMVLFCILSFINLTGNPTLVNALSAAADVSLAMALIATLLLLPRIRLETAALAFGAAILCYSVINLLLFPSALVRVICQPIMAVAIAVAFVDSRRLRGLSIAAWLTTALLFWLGDRWQISEEPIIDFVALCAINAIILLVLNQFHARMNQSLAWTRDANVALRDAQAGLEAQVTERTATLEHALDELQTRAAEQARLLEQTEQQRATIRALGVPVLPVSRTTLAVPLVGIFDAERLSELQAQALPAIERSGARYLVIDITGVPFVDQEVAQGILQVAQAVRLMGANVVLAGIRPEVAQALVGLGLDLRELRTAATLQEGIAATV